MKAKESKYKISKSRKPRVIQQTTLRQNDHTCCAICNMPIKRKVAIMDCDVLVHNSCLNREKSKNVEHRKPTRRWKW